MVFQLNFKFIRFYTFILGFVILFTACEKESSSDTSRQFDNYLIIESNTGVKDTLILEGKGCCRNFDFRAYKSSAQGKYEFNFTIGATRANPSWYFDLDMAKSDSLIRLGQPYSNNPITYEPSVELTIWNIYTINSYKSTHSEITFTKYAYPGRISGNFKTYRNNNPWYKGTFNFVSE